MILVGNEQVKLLKGRDNLALTVMVPYDCENNCKFCISKKEYAKHTPDKGKVLSMLRKFYKEFREVNEVVITGGEPMQDIEFLRELVKQLLSRIKVFINTSFIRKNLKEFIDFVNTESRVRGVNISRHTDSYDNDCKILCGIAGDEKIGEIKKPVRINCVIGESTSLIDRVIERWKGFKNVEVSFRADFTKTTEKDLHNPFCVVNSYLASKYEYIGHTQCHVCDTTAFKIGEGMVVKYHRGLKTTSIQKDGYIEVNDFVLRQDGKLFIDWVFKTETKVKIKGTPIAPAFSYGSSPYTSCGGGCGHHSRYTYSGCGYRGC